MEVILERIPIGGLGRIDSPLALVSIQGEQKLVVSPWAAIGTDALGLAISGALFFASESAIGKIIAGVGALWMGTALIVETRKLVMSDERVLIPERL